LTLRKEPLLRTATSDASASRNCTGTKQGSCRCMPLIFGVYFRLNLMTI
jgi:hypothetical protein